MSRLQGQANRRTALLAGSSVLAAGLSAFFLTLTPSVALAANECGVIDPGPGADAVLCPASPPTYTSGITYTTAGPFALTTAGAVNAGTGGIAITAGATGDPITMLTTAGAVTHTGGVGIRVNAGSGATSVTTGSVSTSSGTGTGAISVVSTTGGAIGITSTSVTSNQTTSVNALEARSSGGTGAVNISVGSANGRLRGIYAQSGGALTINATGTVSVNTTTTGGGVGQIAAIDAATTGAGAMNLTVVNVTGTASTAIRTSASANATINISGNVAAGLGGIVDATPTAWVMDLTTLNAGRTTTVNNNGVIRSTHTNQGSFNDKIIRGAGAGRVVVNNAGSIRGTVDFSAQAEGATFNNTASANPNGSNDEQVLGWHTVGLSTFSNANDVLSTSATGGIYTGHFNAIAPGSAAFTTPAPIGGVATTFDFGGGSDTFNNAGVLVVGEGLCAGSVGCVATETVTTMLGLETFNNSGQIILGLLTGQPDVPQGGGTDRQANDRLVLPGVTFNGSGNSRIALDVNYGAYGAYGHDSCIGSPSAILSFDAAADCVDLSGGSTSGVTLLTLRVASTGGFATSGGLRTDFALRGSSFADGIVLVDVSGAGTSGAGHFAIDPTSELYSPAHGGVIDEGLLIYPLVYDETTQQHKLVSVPGGVRDLTYLAGATADVWRSASRVAIDRQAQLREAFADGESEGGIWVRGSTEIAKRTPVQSATVFGSEFSFNGTYHQENYSITGGLDLMRAAGDGGFSAGLTFGYAHSDLEFDASTNHLRLNGITGGVYASYATGPIFLDGTVSAVGLASDTSMPRLNLAAGSSLNSRTRSIGAQLEGGARFDLWSGAFVEPLVSMTYVETGLDKMLVPATHDPSFGGNTVAWDTAVSLRGGLGARFGLEHGYGAVRVRYSLLGRVWNEFEGEARLAVHSLGPDILVADDFTGAFGEIGGGLNLSDDGGALAGFLNAGGTFNDEYRSANVTAGFRYQW